MLTERSPTIQLFDALLLVFGVWMSSHTIDYVDVYFSHSLMSCIQQIQSEWNEISGSIFNKRGQTSIPAFSPVCIELSITTSLMTYNALGSDDSSCHVPKNRCHSTHFLSVQSEHNTRGACTFSVFELANYQTLDFCSVRSDLWKKQPPTAETTNKKIQRLKN